MKTIFKYISIAIIGGAALTSCEDFLTTTPHDFTAPENFYTTQENCEMALAGVYCALTREATYGNFYSLMMSNVDDMSYYRNVVSKLTTFTYGNDYNASQSNVLQAWTEFYKGINNANLFLERIDGSELSDEVKTRMKGEARFLRAFYHFILVQGWYEVPIRKESTKDINKASLKATPHGEALKWIISEMEACVDMVDDSAYDKSPSYVKKNTVMGILARVYLWSAGYPNNGGKADYEKAAEWAKKVIDSKKHKLNPSYEDLFKNMCADKYDATYNESIWEADFLGSRNDGNWTYGRIGNTIGLINNSAIVGYGFYSTSLLLWDLFEATDIRRDITCGTYEIAKSGAKTYYTDTQIVERPCGKFRRDWEAATSDHKNYTPENFPILRYSDVLLMYAEAVNEAKSAPTTEAYAAINEVRTRAGISSLSALDYNGFQKAVRDERARELVFEGTRRYDLVRWGLYMKAITVDLAAAVKDSRWTTGTNTASKTGGVSSFISKTEEKHQFFPIPEKELGVNTLLDQNKYWTSKSE